MVGVCEAVEGCAAAVVTVNLPARRTVERVSRSCAMDRMENRIMSFEKLGKRMERISVYSGPSLAVLAACLGGSTLSMAAQSAARTSIATSEVPAAMRVDAVEPGQKTFSTPGEASEALISALTNADQDDLLRILGPGSKEILSSGDETEDKDNRDQFVQRYRQMHRLVNELDGTTTLYIGAENWPAPIPLVHKGATWYFDTEAGKQEILYRRIGENELTVIQVCRELVDAQKEYYAQPHDGGSERQYAQRILSQPGKQNGLYWEAPSGETESPLGPLVASAEAEGYTENANQEPQAFHGYYFRVLKGHGAAQSGTAQSYLVDGKMKRGFAFVAYPAEYRSSGVMTFVVDQDGVVYEKDLGPKSEAVAKSLTLYDRNRGWRKAD